MPAENTGSGTSCSGTARPPTGAMTGVVVTHQQYERGARRSQVRGFSSRLPLSFGGGRGLPPRRSPVMRGTKKPEGTREKSGLRIPGFAQLQRLGKSLMLPIAVLPAAGILLRLGQPDLLGKITVPVIGPFFQAMSAAGGAIFAHLPLLFAIGVAIGFAKKADGSTALAAAAGYLVIEAVF